MVEKNIDAKKIGAAFAEISRVMSQNKDCLVELDSQNGDGDLGISMDTGFAAVAAHMAANDEADLGRVMMRCGKIFNEHSPSSLGTILSFGMMGMAKALKGSESAGLADIAGAMRAGVEMIMEKAGSKPGEKTILDALCPAIETLEATAEEGCGAAFRKAAESAAKGSESTREMRSVHGRAAYYGDKSIGMLDGGSVAGRLIFEALAGFCSE